MGVISSTVKINDYSQYIKRKWLVLLGLVAILLFMCILSISVGSSGLSVPQILKALFRQGTVQSSAIVWNVRMPRIGTAIGVGIALAMTGCIMQNLLRNPLARLQPLSFSGASFGAAVAIVSWSWNPGKLWFFCRNYIYQSYLVTLFAFIGVWLPAIILGLSRIRGLTIYHDTGRCGN